MEPPDSKIEVLLGQRAVGQHSYNTPRSRAKARPPDITEQGPHDVSPLRAHFQAKLLWQPSAARFGFEIRDALGHGDALEYGVPCWAIRPSLGHPRASVCPPPPPPPPPTTTTTTVATTTTTTTTPLSTSNFTSTFFFASLMVQVFAFLSTSACAARQATS